MISCSAAVCDGDDDDDDNGGHGGHGGDGGVDDDGNGGDGGGNSGGGDGGGVFCGQSFVVRSLVRRYGVQSRQVAVLSQYRAQCSLIAHQLQQQFSDVTVSTVISAQGTHCHCPPVHLSVCL